MTRDIETLTQIIRWFLFAAAFFTTAFPFLYAFAPWRTTHLGQLLMFMTVSFAIVLDVTVLFQFWEPEDILIYFWVQAVCFVLITISTSSLTVMMLRMNFSRKKERDPMFLPSKLYNAVKYAVLIGIPAVSTAYIGFDAALDGALPHENQVAKSLAVLALLLGTLTGISSRQYNNSDERFDGSIEVNANDPSILHGLDLDQILPEDLARRKAVTLRVDKNHQELPDPEFDA